MSRSRPWEGRIAQKKRRHTLSVGGFAGPCLCWGRALYPTGHEGVLISLHTALHSLCVAALPASILPAVKPASCQPHALPSAQHLFFSLRLPGQRFQLPLPETIHAQFMACDQKLLHTGVTVLKQIFFCTSELSEIIQCLVVMLNLYIQMGHLRWTHTIDGKNSVLFLLIICTLCKCFLILMITSLNIDSFFFFNYIVSLVFGSLFSNMLPGKYKNGF